MVHPPMAHQPILHQPVVHQPRSSHSTVVVPLSPAQLECARSNPLIPGTLIHPPRHPDQPEPIKLNYRNIIMPIGPDGTVVERVGLG